MSEKPVKVLARALACAAVVLALSPAAEAAQAPKVTIQEQYTLAGGNGKWYTEESYWSAPVIVDLNGDGKLEAINTAHSLSVVDAATGDTLWKVNSGCDRSTPYSGNASAAGQIYCTPQVADVDGDGSLEIAVGYNNGSVSLLDCNGYFEPGWPKTCFDPSWTSNKRSVRSLALGDIDGDGRMEIVVGIGVDGPVSLFVYRYDGSLMPGWPQLAADQNANFDSYKQKTGNAFSYGIFGNSVALGDLDGDGLKDIIAPTDTAYIDAFRYDGSLITASPVYGGRSWGKIALYEDYDQELACVNEGWGLDVTGGESRAELYRAELGHARAVLADVDGDGTQEVVVTALMIDRTSQSRTGASTLADARYMTVFILNKDRTRFQKNGWDWTSAPKDLGRPLKSQHKFSIAAEVISEPVCVDLNGDGVLEILVNSFNGKLHCFSLDGQEHGNWPFTMPKTGNGIYEYPGVPTCADLNGDGTPEIIVASWTDCEDGGFNQTDGGLYILDSNGNLLASQDLHPGYKTYEGKFVHANGVKSAPAVADVDGDGRFEVLLNTSHYALCAYELSVDNQAHGNIAYPSFQNVTVNGKPVTFQMYALKDAQGYDTNYIKLRDLAYVLDNFNVGWDQASGTIRLYSLMHYTPNGTEMWTPFSGPRAYLRPSELTDVDHRAMDLDMIRLTDDAGNGYSYYKLRDLADALNFTVTWSQAQGIGITTPPTP